VVVQEGRTLTAISSRTGSVRLDARVIATVPDWPDADHKIRHDAVAVTVRSPLRW
jgi:hypothetical protein